MEFEKIDLARLNQISYHSGALRRAQEKNVEPSRKLYIGDDLVYKIWKRHSRNRRLLFVDGVIIKVRNNVDQTGREQLLGFLCGLFNEEVCPAYVENIYSGNSIVGYITKRGTPLTPNDVTQKDCKDFVDVLIQRSLDSGFIYRDLHPGNLIRLPDGRISLIDLDTPLAELSTLDLNVEVQTGSLRRQRMPQYREFVLDYFDRRVRRPELRKVRKRLATRPPQFRGRVLQRANDAALSFMLPGTKRTEETIRKYNL